MRAVEQLQGTPTQYGDVRDLFRCAHRKTDGGTIDGQGHTTRHDHGADHVPVGGPSGISRQHELAVLIQLQIGGGEEQLAGHQLGDVGIVEVVAGIAAHQQSAIAGLHHLEVALAAARIALVTIGRLIIPGQVLISAVVDPLVVPHDGKVVHIEFGGVALGAVEAVD